MRADNRFLTASEKDMSVLFCCACETTGCLIRPGEFALDVSQDRGCKPSSGIKRSTKMHFLTKLVRLLKQQHEQSKEADGNNRSGEGKQGEKVSAQVLSPELKDNLDAVRARFGESSDLIIREFSFGKEKDGRKKAALVFLDGMVNLSTINDDIIEPLMRQSWLSRRGETSDLSGMDEIRDRLLTVGEVKTVYTYNKVIQACLSGDAVLMTEGSCKALNIGAKGW
ncbi:MAG: spore germination protein, partial [Ruminococcaceae bacterium]|nr:spore germination protein [Oscillospiraceae bacterium]